MSGSGSVENTDGSNLVESPSSRSTDILDLEAAAAATEAAAHQPGDPEPARPAENRSNNLDSESVDIKNFIPSESMSSVPSWASSISLDSASEEAALEFMRNFVKILFVESSAMNIHLKAEFGEFAKVRRGGAF